MAHFITIAGETFAGQTDASGKIWLDEGLKGWYDGAANRVSVDPIPGQHGGFRPAKTLLNPRHLEFAGAFFADNEVNAETWARAWLSKLSATDGFDVSVQDEVRTLTARCWVEGNPLGKRLPGGGFEFSLPLVAPDPILYGPSRTVVKPANYLVSDGLTYPLTYPLNYGAMTAATLSGYLQLTNAGTAPVYPSWRVRGPITVGFTITSDGYTITFNRALAAEEEVVFGPAAGGRAILQDGSDVSIFLTTAQWVQVPADGQRGFVFSPLGSAVGGSFVEATIKDGWL